MSVLDYTPPPTIERFIRDYRPGELFYDWIVGPVGSGKTTGLFFKLVYMASLQDPDNDGIRRTKAVIVRNTLPQLKDTTISSWNRWFQDGIAGAWKATEHKFLLKFGDVECEVLFRPLDTSDDITRVLSLDVTFAIIDEFVKIPRQIVDALSGRLGRFPWNATNWGMWGSSNPDTEDNWWYDFLHQGLPDNARYFVQPSGFSPQAENLANLPGGAAYYTNQAKGKSDAWIRQFLCSEWGFSAEGKSVVSTFNPEMHTAKSPLKFNPDLELVMGMDPGIQGSAMIFGQEDHHGRLLVLGELVQSGMGAKRLIQERVNPYLRQRFPNANIVIAPDPAAANRTQTDERTVIDEFKRFFKVKIETNNRLPLRLGAIEHYTTRLTDAGSAILIDEKQCPNLIRALKGGWRYVIDMKRDIPKPEPEKNAYSHVGDAFGYLCRYFHRQFERDAKYASYGPAGKTFTPPKAFGSSYHFR